ncbi:Sec-independent protein translocase subunit TatA/TatB [Halorussus litoreus]|uniref:Sec-independent protein translocase subunit TatA/TatB n=1 Tax=Halorussus litoreus TaxID=1710536 RepID=UPI000E280322|nr:twin-arginine translocase TatA/TatE family subunit [Halorussus litoreus]
MGPVEIAIVTVLGLLLFGGKRLSNVGEALGETLGYVRGKAQQKVDDDARRSGSG